MIILHLTIFHFSQDLRHGNVNLEFISFVTGVILHFYMPCYYSDILMEKVGNSMDELAFHIVSEIMWLYIAVIINYFRRYKYNKCVIITEEIEKSIFISVPIYFPESEMFRQTVYSCGWEKQPDKRLRQIILFMMTRATTPLGITTIFYSICLDTFAEVIII